MPSLHEYLLLAAALFSIGLAGALTRRHIILVLVSIEMMLNAANVNLVAFWRYGNPAATDGVMLVLFGIAIAGAEAAVGLALLIAIYRRFRTSRIEEVARLKG
ncbi:MAG: NADH-quinone oxidoreductase subunit NuoK [Verrucomicrobiae bacterium]|nr:NADH-quinone oxidoreductase subunit NuoK [Verrucomicrobiae bacterium]